MEDSLERSDVHFRNLDEYRKRLYPVTYVEEARVPSAVIIDIPPLEHTPSGYSFRRYQPLYLS